MPSRMGRPEREQLDRIMSYVLPLRILLNVDQWKYAEIAKLTGMNAGRIKERFDPMMRVRWRVMYQPPGRGGFRFVEQDLAWFVQGITEIALVLEDKNSARHAPVAELARSVMADIEKSAALPPKVLGVPGRQIKVAVPAPVNPETVEMWCPKTMEATQWLWECLRRHGFTLPLIDDDFFPLSEPPVEATLEASES